MTVPLTPAQVDDLASMAQVATAQVLAEALVTGFSVAGNEPKRGITELAQTAMLEAALLAFDGMRARITGQIQVGETLRANLPVTELKAVD